MVQPTGTPKTVILATSARDVSDRFTGALESAGHRTVTVRSSDALLRHVRKSVGTTDLLVVDLTDEDIDFQTMRTIHATEPRIPIVVFSGSVRSAHDVRSLAELGVNSYVNEHSEAPDILPALSQELFPDSFNRRTSTRVVLDIPVVYRHGDTIATAPMLNLGKGGLGLRTLTLVDAGTKVRVTFRLPDSHSDLNAAARVAWSDQRTGLGLQFEEMPTPNQSAVDEFVDRHIRNGST